MVQRLVLEERGGALIMSRFVSPRDSDMIASLIAWMYQSISIGRFGCKRGYRYSKKCPTEERARAWMCADVILVINIIPLIIKRTGCIVVHGV